MSRTNYQIASHRLDVLQQITRDEMQGHRESVTAAEANMRERYGIEPAPVTKEFMVEFFKHAGIGENEGITVEATMEAVATSGLMRKADHASESVARVTRERDASNLDNLIAFSEDLIALCKLRKKCLVPSRQYDHMWAKLYNTEFTNRRLKPVESQEAGW